MQKILIVEDEPSMRLGLKDNLEFEGFQVDIAEDGRIGLDKILSGKYDLILLDVMLPHISGFEICKTIRKRGVETPVILLTAKGEEIDKVLGLELGADDYVTKPFGLRELLARVKAVLRRSQPEAEEDLQAETLIGQLKINFQNYSAQGPDGPLKLSHKEFEILRHLWQHRNETVSRSDLLVEVWGYDSEPTTRTVDNFIARLRQKTEPNPNKPTVILTVHGIGYKMVV